MGFEIKYVKTFEKHQATSTLEKHFQPHYQNTFYVYYYKGKLLRDGTTPTKKSYNLLVKFIKENQFISIPVLGLWISQEIHKRQL